MDADIKPKYFVDSGCFHFTWLFCLTYNVQTLYSESKFLQRLSESLTEAWL